MAGAETLAARAAPAPALCFMKVRREIRRADKFVFCITTSLGRHDTPALATILCGSQRRSLEAILETFETLCAKLSLEVDRWNERGIWNFRSSRPQQPTFARILRAAIEGDR